MKKKVLVLLSCFLLFLVSNASSTPILIGDVVYAELIFPSCFDNQETITPSSATVGSGVEFSINTSTGRELFTVDIGDSYIKMQIDTGSSMTAGFVRQLSITGIDWFGDPSVTIQGVTLDIGNEGMWDNPVGIVVGDVAFTEHSLTFEWGSGAYWPRASWAQINLIPSSGEDDPPPSIPEPSTIILFGLGLLGLAGVGRKK